jgi:cobyrinic acid a,c-diamide synthase
VIAIKLDSKMSATAGGALERHAAALYTRRGMRVVGVVELRHVERTEPAPDEDKEPSVKLRITGLEIANQDQEDVLREAMSALYLHRNAQGVLDEQGDIDLADRTLTMTGGLLHAIEAARMRVAVAHWADQCRRALAVDQITVAEMRHELDAVAQGLERVLRGEPADGEQP